THAAAAMKMQKPAFFRDAPAPWQVTTPGGPVKKADCSGFCYSLLKTVCYPRTDHHSPPVVLVCFAVIGFISQQ
ncbi:hypothetical protein N6N78_26850, partial [Escherichia albertii]|uniref:hypothetical protein n=1 Tax=Escherichia albertii TaxID=208962 RepID=UPI0021D509B4